MVREASEHLHEDASNGRGSQIKEKFGALKLYYPQMSVEADGAIRDRIKWLEAESLRTCGSDLRVSE